MCSLLRLAVGVSSKSAALDNKAVDATPPSSPKSDSVAVNTPMEVDDTPGTGEKKKKKKDKDKKKDKKKDNKKDK